AWYVSESAKNWKLLRPSRASIPMRNRNAKPSSVIRARSSAHGNSRSLTRVIRVRPPMPCDLDRLLEPPGADREKRTSLRPPPRWPQPPPPPGNRRVIPHRPRQSREFPPLQSPPQSVPDRSPASCHRDQWR